MFSGRMNTLVDLAHSDWEYLKESLSHTVGFDRASANRAFEQVANESVTRDSYIAFMETMRGWDATAFLAEIKVPALVLARREFRAIPIETMRRLAAELPNGELVTLEGAATAMTTPDVGEAIRAFFARVFATQAPPRAPAHGRDQPRWTAGRR
jgi:pimeloyl-ACP methyl ester carboxylesterase